jgi:hypothetical protein
MSTREVIMQRLLGVAVAGALMALSLWPAIGNAQVYAPTRFDTKTTMAQSPPDQGAPTIEVFTKALAPYGAWLSDRRYGRVWAPFEAGYRPYHNGWWQLTKYGLTWMSSEPFAWAVFHYGYWVWKDRWLWRPDTIWAPAWVSWREADGYYGWAPMPPDPSINVVEERWHFVAGKDLLRSDLLHAVAAADQRKAYALSRPMSRYMHIVRGNDFPAGPDAATLRSLYHLKARPQPLYPRATGRFPPEAWQDPGVLERIRWSEEVQRRSSGKRRPSS